MFGPTRHQLVAPRHIHTEDMKENQRRDAYVYGRYIVPFLAYASGHICALGQLAPRLSVGLPQGKAHTRALYEHNTITIAAANSLASKPSVSSSDSFTHLLRATRIILFIKKHAMHMPSC